MAENWLRWHIGSVTDPKWRVVAQRASHAMSRNVTVGHVLSVWAAMLECASQASVRGTLEGWSDEDVGVGLDIPEAEITAIREAMQDKVLQGFDLTGWNRRQPKREDTTAAERKRQQRERDKVGQEQKSRSVTQRHDRGEERRVEKKEQKQDQETGAPAAGSRLPRDWSLPQEWADWAASERPEIDAQAEAAKFADFWHGKAGKDARKADWLATWRNWIRRADAPRRGRGGSGGDIFAVAQ